MKHLFAKSLIALTLGLTLTACNDNEEDRLKAQVAELEAQVVELETENAELDTQNSELEALNTELETENTELKTENTELESENTELETQVSDLEPPIVPSLALVQTVAPDFTSSEVVGLDVSTQEVSTGFYVKDASDYTIFNHNHDIYHLGRFFTDTITKYSANFLEAEEWSYSSQDSGDATSRNLYAIAFVNDTKAYLIRYGSDKVWIVNPEAQSADEFKTGELDLSAYNVADTATNPNPSAAVVHDGKLYIAMQRWVDDAFTGIDTAYVAVFDTATDQEIETNANSDDAVKGIPLTGINPLENSLVVHNDILFVTSNDSFLSADKANSKIETIDTNSYALTTLASTADLTDNTGAAIQTSVVVSDTKGYFVATKAVFTPSYHEVSTLYEFNPTTGDITEEMVANTGTEDINFIALDHNNFLWLSVASAATPGIDIIDTNTNARYVDEDNVEVGRLLTDLNPGKIVFLD